MKSTRDHAAKVILNKYTPSLKEGSSAFSPANIALCKYWGKRNPLLNLPINDSISVSLKDKGTQTSLRRLDTPQEDCVTFNNLPVAPASPFYQKVIAHVDLFRAVFGPQPFAIETINTVPTAAGVASSASGFAALTRALANLYSLPLTSEELSILARLGSGSACRSIFNGFVRWHKGSLEDGSDSYAHALPQQWPTLKMGLLTITDKEKNTSSRQGMQHTIETSHLYQQWPTQVTHDIVQIEKAIYLQDFALLGSTAEHNAMTMHATMLSSWPPLFYWMPETITLLQQVWSLRKEGVAVYVTMDAGPNIKLLFEQHSESAIKQAFPAMEVCLLFN